MNDVKDVPYIVHEGDMARMERSNRRLGVVVIILILLCLGSNVAWLMYESQFEEVSTTIEQEVDQQSESGNNSFVGGDIVNGTTESKN